MSSLLTVQLPSKEMVLFITPLPHVKRKIGRVKFSLELHLIQQIERTKQEMMLEEVDSMVIKNKLTLGRRRNISLALWRERLQLKSFHKRLQWIEKWRNFMVIRQFMLPKKVMALLWPLKLIGGTLTRLTLTNTSMLLKLQAPEEREEIANKEWQNSSNPTSWLMKTTQWSKAELRRSINPSKESSWLPMPTGALRMVIKNLKIKAKSMHID